MCVNICICIYVCVCVCICVIFREDNFITKKVRVVSLATDMPTGPPLHPYQILSNYLKQYGRYGLHKILASWEIAS